MTKHEEKRDPDSCWNKALENEPVFVIRAKDPVCGLIVNLWCAIRINAGLNMRGDDKLTDAEHWIQMAERWRGKHPELL